MKTGNTETYRQVWEIQANTDTYRLKILKQIFRPKTEKYIHTDRRPGNTCIVE